MLQSSVSCDMLVFMFYVFVLCDTMAYWYDGAALAATRSPVIALFWCLIKFTTTTTTTTNLKHIGRLVRMSVSGYRGQRFEPRHQYVVSLNKTLRPHCFSRLSCEMSTRWGQPREGCSVL